MTIKNYIYCCVVALSFGAVYVSAEAEPAAPAAEEQFDPAALFGGVDQLQAIDFEIQNRLNDVSDCFWNRVYKMAVMTSVAGFLGLLSAEGAQDALNDSDWLHFVKLAGFLGLTGRELLAAVFGDMPQIIAYTRLRNEIKNKMIGLQHGGNLIDENAFGSYGDEE